MPTYIIKLQDQDRDWYLMWSSIVDAPVSYGMSLEEFKDWYLEEYGDRAFEFLEEKLERVEQTGTSARHTTLESLLSCNRAGDKEACLTKEELIEKYCRRK